MKVEPFTLFTKFATLHGKTVINTATLNSVNSCEPFFGNFLLYAYIEKVLKNPSQPFTPFTELYEQHHNNQVINRRQQ
jgi:hypothetical protein